MQDTPISSPFRAPTTSSQLDTLGSAFHEFECLHEFIVKARANLKQGEWDYISGGAESETTLKRNRLALDSIALRPRVLRDVSKIDASVERLGRRIRLPVVLAPIGSLECMHPEGAVAVARGAGQFGVPHMLSSSGDPGLVPVAKGAPDALRIYQLYVRGDDAFVEDRVRQAIDHGYKAFCFTVDTAVYSRRERDIAKRFVVLGRKRASGHSFQAGLSWRTVAHVKEKFDIPVIVKGIATAEDARIAVEHGVDWVYVSNHGGRQLDHGRGSMDVVPEVVDAVKGRAKVIVDGSICRGSDVIKGIASGADLVGIGRMQCYALAAGGTEAVVRMLEILEDEIHRALANCGVTGFSELEKAHLHPAAPVVTPPHVFSAFPLLKVDDYRY
jgi:isopentenyl diphosphate isomerase/L-lactate dehydrogenase-like FMN-dependent dehydrogenase